LAVAWDVNTGTLEVQRTGTTDPQTWTHTPAGTLKGVVVAIVHGTSSTDHVSTVTYGGVALSEVIRRTDTANEPGAAELWFLGSGIPTGAQTVSVDLASATTDDIHFVSMGVTADRDTFVVDSDGINDNTANPSVTLQYGGGTCLAMAALYGGGASPASFTPNANCSAVQDFAIAAFYSTVIRQTTPGTADFAIGGTSGTDDVAYVALAVCEVPSVAATLTTAGLNSSATATESIPSTAAVTTAGLNASATATESIPSTAALTTGGLSVDASANHEEDEGVSGTADLTTAGLSVEATATESYPTTAALTTAGLGVDATAVEAIPATGALTTAGLSVEATAAESIPATAALTTAGLNAAATSAEGFTTAADLTTAGLSVAATVDVAPFNFSAALTTAGLSVEAEASEGYAAAIECLLAGLSVEADAAAIADVTGTAELTLAGLSCAAVMATTVPAVPEEEPVVRPAVPPWWSDPYRTLPPLGLSQELFRRPRRGLSG
jgi:hypothetical protein